MITIARPCSRDTASHAKFLAMLPAIRAQARRACCSANPDAQEEFIAETLANAFCAYERLVERGKESLAYPTPLAGYAIKQVRCGRRVGGKLNAGDVLSPANRRVAIERLDQYDAVDGTWREIVVEDRHATPADTAAARLDLAQWFRLLPKRKRRIAQMLAAGESTGVAARRCGVSPGRISQLRQELRQSWQILQGETTAV